MRDPVNRLLLDRVLQLPDGSSAMVISRLRLSARRGRDNVQSVGSLEPAALVVQTDAGPVVHSLEAPAHTLESLVASIPALRELTA